METAHSIVWFRQDLRMADNPALLEAAQRGQVLAIYIDDDTAPAPFKLGSASKVWLYHSLNKLNQSLGGKLNCYQGDAASIIAELAARYQVEHVYWNASFEPWCIAQAEAVVSALTQAEVSWHECHGNYLWHPQAVLKDDGSFYKVFTPYKKRAYTMPPRAFVPVPQALGLVKDVDDELDLKSFLLPEHSWHAELIADWQVGEDAAHQRLDEFIEHGLQGYKQGRNCPGQDNVSRLSPHLHFGEISPAQIWAAVIETRAWDMPIEDSEHFLSEVVWREFSAYLLYHFPQLPDDNFNSKFDAFPWRSHASLLRAWQTGQTGYPLVDAGMRELWQTGYMHNRVRMVVASFLVKNLNTHWHHGRDWFWDCLVDADLANNSASWQWVAGCGADAAPYFRIFNPTTQGEKFDPQGAYTRRWVPELNAMPNKYLYKPWAAPEEILVDAGVVLGQTYPKPIVDLALSRNKALEAYKQLS